MVLEKNTISGEDGSVRELKAQERGGTQGVLFPILL